MGKCPHFARHAIEISGIDDDSFNRMCLQDMVEDAIWTISGINDDDIIMIRREIFRYENPRSVVSPQGITQ
jgi:hypothetical protein